MPFSLCIYVVPVSILSCVSFYSSFCVLMMCVESNLLVCLKSNTEFYECMQIHNNQFGAHSMTNKRHGYRLQSKFDQKWQINSKWSYYCVFHFTIAKLHWQIQLIFFMRACLHLICIYTMLGDTQAISLSVFPFPLSIEV